MEDNEAVAMLIASNCTGLMSADVFSYAFTTLDLMLLSEQPFEKEKKKEWQDSKSRSTIKLRALLPQFRLGILEVI